MEILYTTKNEDRGSIRTLYESAFKDSEAFVDYYFSEKFLPEKAMAIKEDQQIIAMLHLNPFQVEFYHKTYDISYIVAVATDIRYRKRGFMGALMEAALNKLYQAGEVFSLLMPIDSRIYERYGFGFIEDHLNFDVSCATLTVDSTDYTCWTFTEKDFIRLVYLFEKFSKQFNLVTLRRYEDFERLYHEIQADEGEIIVFEEGYMMTYYEDHVFHVREFVFTSEQAFKEMISYIKDKTCMGKAVIADHSKSMLKYFTPNIPENIIKLQPFMMARIINVEAFLKNHNALFKQDVRIKVTDPFIKENNLIFSIHNGQVNLSKNDNFDIELDIKQLTQFAFGYIKPSEFGIKNFLETKLESCSFFNEFV